jgi:adenosylcobinamide-phosphate synthase
MASMNVLVGAVLVDVLFGEPPGWLHPVTWMGRSLGWLETRAPRGEYARLLYGASVAIGGMCVWGGLGWLVERFAPWPLQVLALKPTFAGRALLDAGHRVRDGLQAGSLDQARSDLQALVSRPTATLDTGLVAAAAIESLAENLVDSWVAPLVAYAGFGLGGAYAYRATNTMDAMWGYRTPSYEHLGKFAARLDDVLNWLPARAGAVCLLLAGYRPRQTFKVWRRDAGRTASPNAGHPMAAVAGQLGVRLEKRDSYVLNAEAPEPSEYALNEASQLVARAMLLAAGGVLIIMGLRARA